MRSIDKFLISWYDVDIGEKIMDGWDIKGAWAFILIALIGVPFAIWKLIDIVVWVFNNVHISIG